MKFDWNRRGQKSQFTIIIIIIITNNCILLWDENNEECNYNKIKKPFLTLDQLYGFRCKIGSPPEDLLFAFSKLKGPAFINIYK